MAATDMMAQGLLASDLFGIGDATLEFRDPIMSLFDELDTKQHCSPDTPCLGPVAACASPRRPSSGSETIMTASPRSSLDTVRVGQPSSEVEASSDFAPTAAVTSNRVTRQSARRKRERERRDAPSSKRPAHGQPEPRRAHGPTPPQLPLQLPVPLPSWPTLPPREMLSGYGSQGLRLLPDVIAELSVSTVVEVGAHSTFLGACPGLVRRTIAEALAQPHQDRRPVFALKLDVDLMVRSAERAC